MTRLRLIWNVLLGRPVMSRMHVTPFAVVKGSERAFVVDNVIDYSGRVQPYTAEEAQSAMHVDGWEPIRGG